MWIPLHTTAFTHTHCLTHTHTHINSEIGMWRIQAPQGDILPSDGHVWQVHGYTEWNYERAIAIGGSNVSFHCIQNRGKLTSLCCSCILGSFQENVKKNWSCWSELITRPNRPWIVWSCRVSFTGLSTHWKCAEFIWKGIQSFCDCEARLLGPEVSVCAQHNAQSTSKLCRKHDKSRSCSDKCFRVILFSVVSVASAV